MTLDWTHVPAWRALAGGGLVGAAAALLVLLNGRVAGVSGIAGGLLRPPAPGDTAWRWAFVGGLAASPALFAFWSPWPGPRFDAGIAQLMLAGLLVGVGTRCAGGCTSGHAICGIARLSPRSMTATLVFVGAAMVTVFLRRHAGLF